MYAVPLEVQMQAGVTLRLYTVTVDTAHVTSSVFRLLVSCESCTQYSCLLLTLYTLDPSRLGLFGRVDVG